MADHLHWRLYVTDNQRHGLATSITTLQMAATVGGPDQCVGGAATASSTYSGSYLPQYAFDGDPGTRWSSTDGGGIPCWLDYQFPAPVSVASIVLGDASGAGPTAFQLQWSDDGSTYTTLGAWTMDYGSGTTQTFSLPATERASIVDGYVALSPATERAAVVDGYVALSPATERAAIVDGYVALSPASARISVSDGYLALIPAGLAPPQSPIWVG
jgi:hypothetical protein